MKDTGERQITECFSKIRKDHRERYNILLDLVEDDMSILDVGCGIGYGSYFLANLSPCRKITGIDISREAISFASKYYSNKKIKFMNDNIMDVELEEKFDVIVAYEIIEHLQDDVNFLKKIYELLAPNGLFIVSTPNEEVLKYTLERFPFHIRHYSSKEFSELLDKSGFLIIQQFTQFADYPLTGFGGRYNIAVCRKMDNEVGTFFNGKVDNCKLIIHLLNEHAKEGNMDISLLSALKDRLQVANDELLTYTQQINLFNQALRLFRDGKYQEGIAIILDNKLWEVMKSSYYYIGSAYEKLSEYEKALSYFNKAQQSIRDFDDNLKGALYFHQAYCLEKNNGLKEDIIKSYKNCLAIIPNHQQGKINLARLL